MGPRVATQTTLHTVWQALTGEIPPLALPPQAIPFACMDSRDIGPGDLFIAATGQNTDGHNYVGAALQAGAQVVICQEAGRAQAADQGALIFDCSRTGIGSLHDLWPDHGQETRETPGTVSAATLPAATGWQNRPLVFVVEDSTQALQRVGSFQRVHRTHPDLKVIGITGSVGKTSTKELTYHVLRQSFATLHNRGNLNSEQGLPLTLLELGTEHRRAVIEMGMYALGEIHLLSTLARPTIGVITNVGPSHLSRLGSMERIAQAKSELIQALPPANQGGVAILNWDDEFVRGMAEQTQARIFRYGLTPDSDLWADEIESAGMEGIRFRFHRRIDRAGVETVHVRVPLLGRHSVHTALRAAAVGLVEGLSWAEIIAGMQSIPGQLRLVVAPGINGATIIDDTYNASPASTIAALNLLRDLEPEGNGRRLAVLGDMLELGNYTDEGHQIVGRRAAALVDTLVTIGELGARMGEEALSTGFAPDQLFQAPDAETAIAWLQREVRRDDLVLVKGSRAVGMDRVVGAISVSENNQAENKQSTSNQTEGESRAHS
ncbi:MAG: UDP-N-acetylmuramoyl-tripeptide--D-alanyl-D-alanine ligase [Litorilinea sp.]